MLNSFLLRQLVPLILATIIAGCAPSYHLVIDQGPPTSGTELPLRFIYQLPVTNIDIDGETLSMIIDAGGHHTFTLQPRTVERLASVQTTGRSTVSADASGRLSRERELHAPEIRLGGIVLRDVDGHEFRFGLPGELDAQIDGYIGAAILMRFSMLVDYPDRIVLYPTEVRPAELDDASWVSLPLDRSLRSPATLEGSAIRAGWDTGANHTIIAPKHARRLGVEGDATIATLTLGDHAFESVDMYVHSLRGPGVDVLLGYGFFSRHRVFFDFAGETVWIEVE
jgi:hypothetical protein